MDLSELYKILQGFNQPKPKPPPKEKRVISEPTLDLVCDAILKGKCKNIIVMSGAGISVAAGLPDFKYVVIF
ncbi:hypothetical protein M1146_04270 [Patescibacteria group bacterium]|nr:hypothetical protein [Patescibacteria group bacterium]